MSFTSLLRQRADVERTRYHVSVNTFGEAAAPSALVVFDNVSCRLSQPILRTGAGNAERQLDSHRLIEHTHVCFMGRDMIEHLQERRSRIKGKDRLLIEGKTYEVQKVIVRSGQNKVHHVELPVQQIDREQDEDV